MKDKTPTSDATPEAAQAAEAPRISRRRLLGGALGVPVAGSMLLAGCAGDDDDSSSSIGTQPADIDAQLRRKVKTIVVIYAENRSFNNLFANFPGVEKPLSGLKPEDYRQLDRDGKTVLGTLPPVPDGWLKVEQTADNGITYPAGTQYQTDLPNAPFVLKGPGGENLPLSVITHDLWHVFYQNQMQINGGRNDMFVAWADSGAFPMGYYANTRYGMHLWDLAREFVLCDNFFMGAFGGSFLNHQYLITATAPLYPDPENSIARDLIATTVSGKPDDPNLKPADDSPASAMSGTPTFGPSYLTPPETLADGTRASHAVNTMYPPYLPTDPSLVLSNGVVDLTNAKNARAMPPLTHEHIGDKLDKKGIDWAWYAGAYQETLDDLTDDDPTEVKNQVSGATKIPNFQYHHQPFNYFRNLAPGSAARSKRLRDGGLGDDESTNHFIADARAGKLPAVTFYKPQGNLNMHAGYADVASGDRHIAHIVSVLRASPQWQHMVVVITVDENGGWWDHVAPPKGDRWGPGTRIPTVIVSPLARKGYVDHTVYDTGSILRLITRTFELETLDGLKERDTAMAARGQTPMGDLTRALDLA